MKAAPLLALCSFSWLPQFAQADAIFETFRGLPGGPPSADGLAVTPDGRVVVGNSFSANGIEAFRWTRATGAVGLGDLPGGLFLSSANAVSANGDVIFGFGTSSTLGTQANTGSRSEAFRWTAQGGLEGLGTLPGTMGSIAYATSANGAVAVGSTESSERAFRWTNEGGMEDLGTLPGGGKAGARSISSDGSIVAGGSESSQFSLEAYRWTRASGMVGLGVLTGGDRSEAYGMSADGVAVVGISESKKGQEAFVWTEGGGMVGLGDLKGGDFFSRANGVSRDGAGIVGFGSVASVEIPQQAFLWTPSGGMRKLADVLKDMGAELGRWIPIDATAISPDGLTIVGTALNETTEERAPYVATLPEPASLLLMAMAALGCLRKPRRFVFSKI